MSQWRATFGKFRNQRKKLCHYRMIHFLQIMASEPGLPLLEGMMHHRFLFSRNRLQRFVAFQTAAGAGQRRSLGSDLLATAPRLAVRPRQPGQHRGQNFPFRADAPLEGPRGAATGCSSVNCGGRGADLKERREWVCRRVGSSS